MQEPHFHPFFQPHAQRLAAFAAFFDLSLLFPVPNCQGKSSLNTQGVLQMLPCSSQEPSHIEREENDGGKGVSVRFLNGGGSMQLGSGAKGHGALPKAVCLPCCHSADDVPKLKTCPELGGEGVRRQRLEAKEETQLHHGARCCPTALEAQPPTRATKPPPLPPLPKPSVQAWQEGCSRTHASNKTSRAALTILHSCRPRPQCKRNGKALAGTTSGTKPQERNFQGAAQSRKAVPLQMDPTPGGERQL